jgi:RNA polymerase sigma-70 factor (ECF subfamily)
MQVNEFIETMNRQKYLNFAFGFTRNYDDAEDLLQECILKAIENSDKFDGRHIKAWFSTIMRHTFINNYRKSLNYPRADLLEKNYEKVEINFDNEQLINSIQLANIYGFHELLKWQSGFKYEEIAAEQNVPIGSIKSRIFLARKVLKEKYGNSWNYK